MTFELPANAADRRRGDAPPAVVVFDMFGTLHQLPGAWTGGREAPERTVERAAERMGEAEAPGPRSRGLRGWRAALALAAMGFAAMGTHGAAADTLLNVSYDPTRELYKAYDKAFAEHWEAEGRRRRSRSRPRTPARARRRARSSTASTRRS